jgi:hypothetical protein
MADWIFKSHGKGSHGFSVLWREILPPIDGSRFYAMAPEAP